MKPPTIVSHLEGAFSLVEDPPQTGSLAWRSLPGADRKEAIRLFYPGWDAGRIGAAQQSAWQDWADDWEAIKVGLFRLENSVRGLASAGAKRFHRTFGQSPPMTIHILFVPDLRSGASRWAGERAIIGINAAVLAAQDEGAAEREVIRQLAQIMGSKQLSRPRTLLGTLFVEGLGSWAVRATKPTATDAEIVGCRQESLGLAQRQLRQVTTELAGQLASTDGPTQDRFAVHGEGDPSRPRAARLSAYSLMRDLSRDAPPAQILTQGFAAFSARANGFWSGTVSSGGTGKLVEEKSAEEQAAIARGGKTADCVGPYSEEGDQSSVSAAGGPFARRGSRLNGRIASPTTLGLIADVKQVDEATQANLEAFVRKFRAAKISALLVAGDTAETAWGIETALDILSKVEVPVLVIAGNREGQGRFRAAMDNVQGRHSNVINLGEIRLVDAGSFSVVGLPGYYDPRYTYAKDGCLYRPEHVAALEQIADRTRARPRILVAHSPPKASGPRAIDYAEAGANVGDTDIAKLVKDDVFDVGIYANLHETGGRAARSDLRRRVNPGTWVRDIHLVVGSANAMPWPMLNGQVSEGMAGLLDIAKDGRVRYRIIKP